MLLDDLWNTTKWHEYTEAYKMQIFFQATWVQE